MEPVNQINITCHSYEIISDFDSEIIPMFNWETYSEDFTYTVYFKSTKIGTITLIPFKKQKDWNIIFLGEFSHKSVLENNTRVYALQNTNINNSSWGSETPFFEHHNFFNDRINYSNIQIQNEVAMLDEETFSFGFKEDMPEYKRDITHVMTVSELNKEMSDKSLDDLEPTLENIFKYLLYNSYTDTVYLLNKNNIS